MLQKSENAVTTLSEGKFGTQTGLTTQAKGVSATKPVCQNGFGRFYGSGETGPDAGGQTQCVVPNGFTIPASNPGPVPTSGTKPGGVTPCVVGTSFSASGNAPCTTCAAASTCGAAGVKTACAATANTVCEGAAAACVAGSTWSAAGTAPCTTCAAASTCGAAGVKTACAATANTVCEGAAAACVAGSTWSAAGTAPCTTCAAASTCGVAGVKTACTTTVNTVCNTANPAFDHSIPWTKGFSGDAADQTMDVKSGEVLKFVWSGNHNVFLMKDKAAFDACDFSMGTNLGAASPVYHTMGAATTYFACEVGSHCKSGQKLSAMIAGGGTGGNPGGGTGTGTGTGAGTGTGTGGPSSNTNGGTGNTAGAGGTGVVGGNGTATGVAAEGSMLIIVGAACGGAVFLAFVVLLSIFFLYKRNNNTKRPLSQQAGRNGMEMSGHQARPKSMAPSFPRPQTLPRGVDSKLTGGMPKGWVSAIDESSGDTYYYHTETAETQWEFPMSPRLAPEAPPSTTMHPNPINNDASGTRKF